MSFRWKVFLVSVAITVTIILTTIGASRYFIQRGIRDTILADLGIMAQLAENLVSSDIDLMKAQAIGVIQELPFQDQKRWSAILEKEVESSQLFMSATIFSPTEIVAAYGQPTVPVSYYDDPFAQMAFQKPAVLSSTRTLPTGEVVFLLYVHVKDGLIAALSVPGLYFAKVLEGFTVWTTGSVYMVDGSGKFVGHRNYNYVLDEYNVFQVAKDTENVRAFKKFLAEAQKRGQGRSGLKLDYQERLVYYTRIFGSDDGGTLAVSALTSEGPLAHVDKGVVVMLFVFLGLGLYCAWLISGFVERQFNTINIQYNNLAELSEVAKNASEAKTNFLANMSHEMRTPLNAIIGFSDLMLCGRYDARESQENLHKVHSAGLILLGIINDILDISKIEAGYLEIVEGEYGLPSLVNDAVSVNLFRIGAKPIEFHVVVDPTLPSKLLGDELRIKQICSNLLSNAFKYTEEGRVELTIAGTIEEETVWLTITVKDTGLGIKEEDLKKLFSAYSQVDTKSNRKIEGTGLGLSIVRKMVEKMGGQIDVQSVYGQGSTFSVTIPQKMVGSEAIGDLGEREQEKPSLAVGQDKGRRQVIPMPYARILLVDDVKANLDLARGILKPYGMVIDAVTSGQAAVDLIRERQVSYDAIFMDHMMPGMDGLEAVRIIRHEIDDDYAKTIPIIALTANAIVGNEKMFLANGFQAYLTKPIDIHRMDQVLKNLVRDKERERAWEAENPPEPVTAAPPPPEEEFMVPGLKVEEALERFGGDREVFVNV
ncbi:MAG: response regulator, partial [Deltaproteobacteria bacterium]|nr:response regulator [Deltaproteobacteria bacterium]